MSLQQIRKNIELYKGELNKEFYLQGAGLKADIDFKRIKEKYPGLFSNENLEELKKSLDHAVSDDEKKRLRCLVESFYAEIISYDLRDLINDFFLMESELLVDIQDSTPVPYMSAGIFLLNEPLRNKRCSIQKDIDSKTELFLNPLLEKYVVEETSMKQKLGFKSRTEFFNNFSGIDLRNLDKTMQSFVESTNDLYFEMLNKYSKRKIDSNTEKLQRHDLSFIIRSPEFDRFFPKELMLRSASDFTSKMGIDMHAGGRIFFDMDNRKGKTSRAFCTYAKIPEEVYLVFPPRGGEDDYTAFLHELGHALHFSNSNAELDMEYKWFGDASVTEAYAVNFDHLTMNETWMDYYLGVNVQNHPEYFRIRYFSELASLRRLAAKLHYERILNSAENLDNMGKYYSEINSQILGVDYSEENYLYDVYPDFYCVRYIRAWMFQAGLEEHLNASYGEFWFHNKSAGAFLKELWSYGQKYSADELARLIGLETLSTDLIKKKLTNYLLL